MSCFKSGFKSSPSIEEIEPEAEVQNAHYERDSRTQDSVASQTRRGLKSRHVQLIALGGSIGTGLFVGAGTTLSLAGPAPLVMCKSPRCDLNSCSLKIIAFIVISAIVWAVVQSLAEMTTYLPVAGTSVPSYVHRFFEPSLAFAAGWNYWYSYSMLVAAEVSAASVVIDYWDSPVYVIREIWTMIPY